MTDTIKIEMDIPAPPEGWRDKGVMRRVTQGEHYLDKSVKQWGLSYPSEYPYRIMERVPWAPKPGELVVKVDLSGFVYSQPFSSFADSELYTWFRTAEDAHKYVKESRALADRIRAESEATNG